MIHGLAPQKTRSNVFIDLQEEEKEEEEEQNTLSMGSVKQATAMAMRRIRRRTMRRMFPKEAAMRTLLCQTLEGSERIWRW